MVLGLIDNHLLASLAIAFMAGIAVASLILLPAMPALLAAASVAVLLVCTILKKQTIASLGCSLLLFFLAGLYLGVISSQEPEDPAHIYNLIDKPRDVVLVGRLLAMPAFDGQASQVRLDLQSVRLTAATPHIPAHGVVQLRLAGPWPNTYAPGSLLAVRAHLQRPARYGVPGIFDYPAELARQNIWVVGYLRSPAQLHLIETSLSWLERLRFLPERLRGRYRRVSRQPYQARCGIHLPGHPSRRSLPYSFRNA